MPLRRCYSSSALQNFLLLLSDFSAWRTRHQCQVHLRCIVIESAKVRRPRQSSLRCSWDENPSSDFKIFEMHTRAMKAHSGFYHVRVWHIAWAAKVRRDSKPPAEKPSREISHKLTAQQEELHEQQLAKSGMISASEKHSIRQQSRSVSSRGQGWDSLEWKSPRWSPPANIASILIRIHLLFITDSIHRDDIVCMSQTTHKRILGARVKVSPEWFHAASNLFRGSGESRQKLKVEIYSYLWQKTVSSNKTQFHSPYG